MTDNLPVELEEASPTNRRPVVLMVALAFALVMAGILTPNGSQNVDLQAVSSATSTTEPPEPGAADNNSVPENGDPAVGEQQTLVVGGAQTSAPSGTGSGTDLTAAGEVPTADPNGEASALLGLSLDTNSQADSTTDSTTQLTGTEATGTETTATQPAAQSTTTQATTPTTAKQPTTAAPAPQTTAPTPVDSGLGHKNINGTYFSTYGAPSQALAWMQSSALIFNRPLPANTPKAPNSDTIARNIDEVVRGNRLYSYGSGIEETGNAPYMMMVDSDREDFVEVKFQPQTCGASTWWGWSAADFEPYLNGAYSDIGKRGIPLPSNFKMNSHDSDFHLLVYDWRRDILIELWTAKTRNLTGQPGVQACWGGVTKNFAKSGSGIYPFPVGADAAGLASAGLTITLEDVRRGSIDHAVGVSAEFVINNFDGSSNSYPASRNDGHCSANSAKMTARMHEVTAAVGGVQNCLHEGQYLRFPKSIHLDAISHPLAKMIAKAGRDYGFVVHDVAGCFCIQAESGYAVSANGFGGDPWQGPYAGTAEWDILWQIDWSQLEVLPRDWSRPSGYRIPCAIPPGRDSSNFPVMGDPRCQAPGDPYRSG